MQFRFFLHFFDLFFRQPAGAGDGDVLNFICGFIHGFHIQNAVGINVEGHFHLRYAAGRGRDSIQNEFAEGFVVRGHGTFALKHVNFNRGLAVCGRGEHLRF